MKDDPKKGIPPRPAPPRPPAPRAPLAPRPPAGAVVARAAAVVVDEEVELIDAASVSPPPLFPTAGADVAPFALPLVQTAPMAVPIAAPVPPPMRAAVPVPPPLAAPVPPPMPLAAPVPPPMPVAAPVPPPMPVAVPVPPPLAAPVPPPVPVVAPVPPRLAAPVPPAIAVPAPPPLSERSAARAADEANSRSSRRFPFEISLDIVSEHNFYAGLSLNISEGGLFVATHQEYPVGTKLEIRLLLPSDEEPTAIMTEVRWVRPHNENADGSAGMGLRFVDLAPDVLLKVQRFVKNRDPLYYEDD
jgi:uncharacterized protein (TIGR02266 family)